MAAPALPLRLALAGACGLLLIGGIAGAATVDEDDATISGTGPAVPGDSTSTTVAGVGEPLAPAPVPGAADPATTATTGGAGATTTTVAGAATATTRGRAGGSKAPGALTAPKPGDYVYEAVTTGAGSGTSRSTTRVEAAGSEGAATLQTITIPIDLGGQQATTRNTVAWGPAGAIVRRSVITAAAMGPQELDCVWQPAFPQYAGGLAVGKAWSYDTRCAGKVQGIDITVQQRAARRVTGSAPAAAPGGTVPTWTIADDTTVVVTTPFGATSVRTVGTQQLAPSLGLPVSARSRIESRMAGAPPSQSMVTTRLLTGP